MQKLYFKGFFMWSNNRVFMVFQQWLKKAPVLFKYFIYVTLEHKTSLKTLEYI